MKLGILSICSNISEDRIRVFRRNMESSVRNSSVDCRIHTPSRVYEINGMFHKSKALNEGIKDLWNSYDVIATVDIDILVPPEVLYQAAVGAFEGNAIWAPCVNVLSEDDKGNGKFRMFGKGSFLAMSIKNWLSCGGYHEGMYGWGAEDDNLFYRIKHAGIPLEIIRDTRVRHISHNRRTPYNSKHNRQYSKSVEKFLKRESKRISHANVLTTSACNLNCQYCSQGEWRKEESYHMTVEQIKNIIRATENSQYEIMHLVVTGGEPTLWENIIPSLKLLKESRVVHNIDVFSNVMNLKKTKAIIPYVDRLRVSHYGVNSDNIAKISEFSKKVKVVGRTRFASWSNTAPYIKGSVPGRCLCDGILFFKDHVYRCSHIPEINARCEINLDDYRIPVSVGYMKHFTYPQGSFGLCGRCIGNANVKKTLESKPSQSEGF